MSSLSVVLSVFLQQDGQKYFLEWLRNLIGVSRYTQGKWELKSILVLSSAQLFERGPLIYNRVREVIFYIPQGYVKGRSIYRRYVEEPHKPQDVVHV